MERHRCGNVVIGEGHHKMPMLLVAWQPDFILILVSRELEDSHDIGDLN
jgi:hypothetical protein